MLSQLKSVVIYLIIINSAAFCIYGIDKFNAKHRLKRIPEFHLLIIAFFGGAIGAFFAMEIFRHKTQKLKFKVVAFLMIIQLLFLVYLYFN